MDPIDPPFAKDRQLPVTETSEIPFAREVVMDVAWGAGLDGNSVVDSAVVAAELIENALSHGAQPAWLRVTALEDGAVGISVFDSDPSLPRFPEPEEWPADDEESGRGLLMCLALSETLWAERIDDGKVVIAVVRASDDW